LPLGLGDIRRQRGNLDAALASYRDSLAIADRLATSDPGNAGWQRDLSVSYNKVGDVQVAQGDLAGALKSYRDSLAIADRLGFRLGPTRDIAAPSARTGNRCSLLKGASGACRSLRGVNGQQGCQRPANIPTTIKTDIWSARATFARCPVSSGPPYETSAPPISAIRRSRCCRSHPSETRIGAGLSNQVGARHRAVRGWRFDGHRRAPDKSMAVGAPRPAIRRREPVWSRHQYRH
jgi:hypothetical protein